MVINRTGWEPKAAARMAHRARSISKPEHLKALASPIRHDIVDRLAAMGPLSVRDLARVLGRKPTAIYRHLVTLEKLGLVRASATSGTRGRPAMVYRTVAPLARLARPPRIKGNRAPMVKIANAMARQAAREYAGAFHADGGTVDGPRRNHAFFELVTSPSPKKLARINAMLDELAQLMWTPDKNPGRPIRVTWFLSPTSRVKPSKARQPHGGKTGQVVKFTRPRAASSNRGGRAVRQVSAA
ncbi:MAG: helix-turn-helix domain-containing protein [Rhizomicrobium sp.]